MSLKIRRGTDAERLTITPDDGELIYATDTKKLWVGDGSTVGGNNVTGYVGSVGNGYWGSVGYTGSGFTGSVGFTGSKGNDGSIGTPGYWGSVGYTGSGYSGSVGTGYWGSVGYTGSQGYWGSVGYTGSFSNTLQANIGLSTYSIIGTSLTISGSTGSISTPAISVKDILPNATDKGIIFGSESDPCGVGIFIKNGSSFNIHSTLANGNAPTFALNAYNGTLMAKESVVDGDILGILMFKGFNGVKPANSIAMASITNDQSFTASSNFIKSDLFIGMPNQLGQPSKQFVMIKSNGDVSANTITVNQFATVSLPSSPVKGMMAFDSTTNQFKGWNGTSWVVLG